MVTESSQEKNTPVSVGRASVSEVDDSRRHKWFWWLLFIGLLLSMVAAYWGIRHIEKQVLAAAPIMLRDAGVDPQGLSFDTEYRNVTVAGQLPEGVTADDVRSILEGKRGSDGEDIRHATVVAYEWVKPEPRDIRASDIQTNDIQSRVVADSEELTDTSALLENDNTAVDPKEVVSPTPDVALNVAEIETQPRVGVLLATGALTLSGRDVSKGQADRLLEAATSAVGPSNVRQQWQAARLPGFSDEARDGSQKETRDPDGLSAEKVEPLADLVASLGDHATAASITLENGVISGSIEARNEQSMELLKLSAGDGVVVTAAVASERPVLATTDNIQENATPSVAVSTPDKSADVIGSQINADASAPEAVENLVDDKVIDHESSGTDATADNTDDQALRQEISALQLEIDALQQLLQDDVFFVHDSSAITRQAQPVLDRVGDAMKKYRRPSVMISGHTDSLSSRNYNLRLSEQRAAAVMHFLTRNGIDAKRLRSQGFGEDMPVSSNKTLPGRRLNRRVEFTARKSFTRSEW